MISHGKSPHYPFGVGKAYDFCDDRLRGVADAAIAAADAFTEERGRENIKNSYQYDEAVGRAVGPLLPEDPDERHAFMFALKRTLERLSNTDDWHDGAYAAERSIGAARAYSDPEFRRALRLHVHGIYAREEDR